MGPNLTTALQANCLMRCWPVSVLSEPSLRGGAHVASDCLQ